MARPIGLGLFLILELKTVLKANRVTPQCRTECSVSEASFYNGLRVFILAPYPDAALHGRAPTSAG